LKGVNGLGQLPLGGGDCTVCHTLATPTPTSASMASFHHASPRNGVGQCEVCHPDPRPSWQPVAPGDNGTASGLSRPTQMACIKCHVSFSGGNMTVTKFTRTDYINYNYLNNWTRTTAHTIPVGNGRINNYGICLSCHHQGGSATPVSLWHAHPSKDPSGNWTFYDQSWDDGNSRLGIIKQRGSSYGTDPYKPAPVGAYYVPGRSKMLPSNNAAQSGIAGFNLFAANYGWKPPQYGGLNSSHLTDLGSYMAPAYDTPAFTRVTVPTVPQLGNPFSATLNATTRAVPVFASIAPIDSPPPAADNVKVKSATHSGGAVTVRASTSNSGGCSTLTVIYGGNSVAMGGATGADCTVTIGNSAYPSGGTTVDVVSSNSLGQNVLGYPIEGANPGALAFSSPTYSVGENGGMATIAVQRILGLTGTVGVNYTSSNGTATAGMDYSAVSGVLSWGDGDTADKSIIVNIANDGVTEGSESVNLALSAATGGATLANPKTALLTIVDDENLAGTVSLGSPSYTMAENGGTATITATRSGGSAGEVSVSYATSVYQSTAVAGVDYPAISGLLTWADGESGAKTFTLSTMTHGQNRGNRTVNLYLNSPSNGVQLGSQNKAVVTIISPAVWPLDPWPSTPNFTSTTGNPSGSFSIGNGANRLLVVAVSCFDTAGATGQAFSVKYGTKTLTPVTYQNTQKNQTWLGYLKEADIVARGNDTLAVTITGNHTATAVFAASYINVNQLQPIADSGGKTWDPVAQTTTEIYASPLELGYGGYAIYNWTTTPGVTVSRSSDDERYTENADFSFTATNVGVASQPFAAPTSSHPKVTWTTQSTTLGGAVSAIGLNALAGKTSIGFSGPYFTVNENAVTATITASRSGGSQGAVGVSYATYDSTALAGTDYVAKTGNLAWADGDMADKSFTINIIDNYVYAVDKTVLLRLSAPTGGALLGTQDYTWLSITNNEAPIAFGNSTWSVSEAASTATLWAVRSGGSQGAAGISYATVPGGTAVAGTDYTAVSGTLSWTANDTTTKYIYVPILPNATYGGGVDKTVKLALTSPTGTAVLGSPDTVFLTIVDDEPALSFVASTYSVNEGGGSVTVSVKRKGNASGAVSVNYATSDGFATAGSDYTATSGTLNWAANDTANKTFTIPIINDTEVEFAETVNITLSNPTAGVFVGNPGTAQLTIIDNDNPGTIAFSAATYSVDEDDPARIVRITATRTGGSDGAVGVSYSTSGGTAINQSDYYYASGTLSWANGDAADKTYDIGIYPDNNWEGNGAETVNLLLSAPTGGAVLGSPSTAVLTIDDHGDWAGTFALSSPTYTVAEDGGSATITATRTGGYNGEVSVRYYTYGGGTATSGVDYTYTSGYLVWPAGDTADKTFSIPIINNSASGQDKTVFLQLASIYYGGGAIGSQNTAVLTIVDDEGKNGTISLSSPVYSVTEDGGAVTITASRTGGSTGAVTVDYATTGGGTATAGADYTSTFGTHTWASGETGSWSFTVPILPDVMVEGDETFNVSLSNPTGGAILGTAAAVVTIEGPAVTALDPWPATPQLTNAGSVNFTIGTGPNRLLVVAICASGSAYTTATGQTFSATYGGKPLTQAALQNTNTYAQTWIGYLTEAEIAARSGDSLVVAVDGAVTGVSAYIASYINVSQSSPVAASGGAYNRSNGAFITPSPLPVGAGGYGIFNWAHAQYLGSTWSSISEGYTTNANVYFNGRRTGIVSRPFATATHTQPLLYSSDLYYYVSFSLVTLNKSGAACPGGACQAPTLTSPTATAISSSAATLGANITADGGAEISSHGTVWGIAPPPTDNAIGENGIANGLISQSRTGLPAGTKIYYRAYATNIAGVGYTPVGSFYTEPSTQASGVNFSAVDYTGMTVSWTRGNGDGVIVLMREAAAVNADPADGTFTGYTADSAFTTGTQIGDGNYVIYKGSGTSVTVTGLTLGRKYYVALYEYQGAMDTLGADQGTNYKRIAATSGQSSSPVAAPTLTSPTATAISSTTATMGANITAEGGTAITTRGTVWGISADPIGNAMAEGGATMGIFSQARTDLPAGTKIYYRGYAINSAVTGYSSGGSFHTEPASQATGVGFTAVGLSGMTVNWTRGSGDGVIVLMKQGSPVDSDPVDGIYTGYAANAAFGSGTQIGSGNYVLYRGTGNSVTVTGLTSGATYCVAAYEYKGSVDTIGVDQGTNYLVSPVIGSQPTNSAPALASPTATIIGSTTVTLGANIAYNGGAALSARGTLWGTTANPVGNVLAEGGTASGIFSQARTGLPSGTKIYYRGYATNSVGTGYSPDGSFYTEPSTQASGVSFSGVGLTGMTVSWARGNGDGVVVLMKPGMTVDSDPVDGMYTAYSANPAFGGGTQIGSGNYVIYKGTGSSVVVTGLTTGTPYYVAVYEYKGLVNTLGVDQGINYLSPAATGNRTPCTAPFLSTPTATAIGSTTATLGANVTSDNGSAIIQRGTVWGTAANPIYNFVAEGGLTPGVFSQMRTDLPAGTKIYYRGYASNSVTGSYSSGGSFYTEPATQASGLNFSAVEATSRTVNWTRGSGDGVIVLMKQGAPVDADPVDGISTSYTGNPQFGWGQQIGSGNYVIYNGTATSVNVAGLTSGATYYVAAYEYKGLVNTTGDNQGTNYKTPAATVPILAFSSSAYSIGENGGVAAITVSRTGGSSGAVAVSYATGSGSAVMGSDYIYTSGTLAWPDGDISDKIINVTVVDDQADDGDKTLPLNLFSPTGGAVMGSPTTTVLTIVDNEDAPATIALTSSSFTVNENAGMAHIFVRRSGNSVGAVLIHCETVRAGGTATSPADYQNRGQDLNWADGEMGEKSFDIVVKDNLEYGVDKTVTMDVLQYIWSGNAVFGTPSTMTLTIVNDDPFLDADGDFVEDRFDLCPGTPAALSVDVNGCSLSQLDSDGDSVTDDLDQCPATPVGQPVNAVGCADADQDGVTDSLDSCPATPPGETVNAAGCGLSQLDSDGDGVSDLLDQCPGTIAGLTVDVNGCTVAAGYLLPDSGQTTSYTSTFGEDHDYPQHPISYTVADSMVADLNTGLVWQQQDDDVKRSWADAIIYCNDLTLATKSDWRLPTRAELSSILDFGRQNPAIDPAFVGTKYGFSDRYWSATPVASYSSAAWSWNYNGSGGDSYFYGKTGTFYVRCVRGGM
ncbi:MAG: DUF1566 domain-containing protein, partial [Desulfobulbaceae bacterium]|nr:DUF1566 domain-containing protein [Desulfobulbaceae bacterium]